MAEKLTKQEKEKLMLLLDSKAVSVEVTLENGLKLLLPKKTFDLITSNKE